MSKLDNAYALLIGVGADLKASVTDATAIYNILADETICGYKEENVILLTEEKADRQGILNALDKLIEMTNEDSSILLFYSGHGGWYEPWNQFYLHPFGMDLDEYETTWVKAEELREKINAMKSRRLVFFLDCCHAAGMFKGAAIGANQTTLSKEDETESTHLEKAEGLAQKIDDDKGISIVSSCREDQLSWILEGDTNSLFTKCLLEVLKAQHKKYYEDEYIRISEVVQYIFRKVPERQPIQNPYVNLQIYDDFVLSYIPENLKHTVVSDTSAETIPAPSKNNEKKSVVTSFREEEGNTNLLLFVHGFSGESSNTFGTIPELLMKESKMDGWDMKPLGYTHHVNPELGKDIWAGILDVHKIADYLSTSIKYKFDKYDRIAIVAHSLGGLGSSASCGQSAK